MIPFMCFLTTDYRLNPIFIIIGKMSAFMFFLTPNYGLQTQSDLYNYRKNECVYVFPNS